ASSPDAAKLDLGTDGTLLVDGPALDRAPPPTPDLAPGAPDLSVDAGSDLSPGFDAAMMLDVATVDAAAGCNPPVGPSPQGQVSCQCGVCSGATGICCQDNGTCISPADNNCMQRFTCDGTSD